MNLTQLLLRAIETRSDEDQLRFLRGLGRLIDHQIRAMEMRDQKPEYLGYAEIERWEDAYPRDFDGHQIEYAAAAPTLDFLTDRLTPALDSTGALVNALGRRDDVVAYLTIMVRHFLTDRQKTHDRVGYRVFKNLEAVVESLEVGGVVKVSARTGRLHRIRRTSGVQFLGSTAGEAATTTALIEKVLASPALTGCVHKLAKKGTGAQRLLRPAVEDLPKAGIGRFEFGELLTPLQTRVREADRLWAGDPLSVAPQPAADAENRIARENRIVARQGRYATFDEYLEALAGDVRAAIDAGAYQERTRAGLHKVLDDWFAHLSEIHGDGDEHPPLTEWATRLGVRRATLWDHVKRLRGIIDQVVAKRAGEGP